MFSKLINFFRPQRLEADIHEELEFHRNQTSGSFGNLMRIQEETREASTVIWLETLVQDIRIAFRLLWRAPSLTGIALLSIAVSVGATSVVFAAIKSVLLDPLPYTRPEQLVQLRSEDARFGPAHWDWVFWNDTQELIRRTRTLESVGIYGNAVFDLGGSGSTPPQALYGLKVSASLFPTLGVSPMLGRNITSEEDQPNHANEMILSYGLWVGRFNRDRSVIGRSVQVNGQSCLVIGVMPPDFNFPLRRGATHTPSPYVEFWAPLRMDISKPGALQGGLGAVARMLPGVSLPQAEQDLASVSATLRRNLPSMNRDRTLYLGLLWDRTVGSAQRNLWLLMGAALMFLLIGCANVANLLLARGMVRQREVAVRMAIGAGRARIVRQFLTENCVLAILGGFGAFVVTAVAWQILPAIAPVSIPRLGATRADWTILAFAVALAFTNGLIFGIAPALHSARAMPSGLQEFGTRGVVSGLHDRTRALLVIGEVAVSVVLVLIGGQLLGSFLGLLRTDPGFQADRVLASVVLPAPERYRTREQRGVVYKKFLDSVRALPGVESAGTVDALPFSGENHGGFVTSRNSSALEPSGRVIAEIDVVGGEYLQALAIRLAAGRWFREEEMQQSSKVVILNDVAAERLWPRRSALGQEICVNCTPENPSNWMQVVGVVSSIRHADLGALPGANVYLAAGAMETAAFLVARTDRHMEGLDKAVRRAIAAIDPDQPVLLSAPMQSLIADSVADRRFIMTLLAVTGGLALLMSAAGVYGVTSYTVARRTQEIGVRMALGATPGNVHSLVFRQGFLSAAIGLSVGLGTALLLMRAIRGVLIGLEAVNSKQVWIAAGLVFFIAAVACWIPARRATRIDPMCTLRQD
jgi:predicted permease